MRMQALPAPAGWAMETADLWTIGYVSFAARFLAPAELARILDVAQAENPRLGVTGLLLHCDGSFVQVLEGPQAGVAEIYRRILANPLHRDVVKLFDHPIMAREFGDWAMACRQVQPDVVRLIVQGEVGTNRRLLADYWHAWS